MEQNEKILELLQTMYSEMKDGFARVDSEMKEGFARVDSEMKDGFARVDSRIDKLQLSIEHDLTPKIEALFDGYTQTTEQLQNIDDKVDKLQKTVNEISIKTLVLDNSLIDLKLRRVT
ncbi:MAG: hypothetical protein H7X94_11175 [Vallitaleaceae bacterium]|nr:hypothetical protein [Vallitaleaceae bacterium]